MFFIFFYFGYGNPVKELMIELGSVTLVEFMHSIFGWGGIFWGMWECVDNDCLKQP